MKCARTHRLYEKRLELGGGPGGPMRFWLVAALGAIIVGSAVLAVWAFFRTSSKKSPPPEAAQTPAPYICTACGHEFPMTPESWQKYIAGVTADDHDTITLVHCPKCGGRHCSVQMSRCPQCRGFYVPYGLENALSLTRGRPPPPGVADICPHCDADLSAWRDKHRDKRR